MLKKMKQKLSDTLFAIDRWYYSENRYFEIANNHELDDRQAWKILKGKYKGIIFFFDAVKIKEDRVTFNVYPYYHGGVVLNNSPKFRRIAKKILLNIIYRLINSDDNVQLGLTPGQEYEERNNNIEEPFVERTIYQESSSVPK
jgi:hypothetical protein